MIPLARTLTTRYLVGIDLGTTHCALAFVDTEQPGLPLRLFAVPQLTGEGRIETLPTLPSFCYLSAAGEWPQGTLQLPWEPESSTIVGQFAKHHGARLPTRLVQSAKSWLCNAAAHRRDKILPLDAADLSRRMSPVEASAQYLIYLKNAWNATMAKGDPTLALEEQEIILTVPASFDEVARALTVEAARQAELLHFTLVEEPQAAFYSWIAQHEREWEGRFHPGDTILVCDVGGGTTDFSLIEIQEKEGRLSFQRMAVGDHLLLGGDNLDAAVAHYVEQKWRDAGHFPLDSRQWSELLAEARAAKETLLAPDRDSDSIYSVVLRGAGASVIKNSLSMRLEREELEAFLLRGFFEEVPTPRAVQLKKSRGLRTMGLPYEDEPSITKHLAHFLGQARSLDEGKGVDYVLFNGGTLKPELFQQAIERALSSWFPHKSVRRLSSASLDLAVARGAAYYGKVRHGLGVAIGGGIPRSYYLEIEVKTSGGEKSRCALTLLTRGVEEGSVFQPPRLFMLRPNEPVTFRLLASHVRLEDREGDLVEIDALEMRALPPIHTLLRFGRKQTGSASDGAIPVRLGIRLTALGTLELWLESERSEHRWMLEFQLRSAEGHDSIVSNPSSLPDETFEKGYLEAAQTSLKALFQPGSTLKPSQIVERLETEAGRARHEWGPTLLRELWTSLLSVASLRKRSPEHEARWWNLAGLFLRPGYGFPLDDFRMKELWKIILSEAPSSKTPEIFIQMCICFRRTAGGFHKGQQIQLSSGLMEAVFDKKRGKLDPGRQGSSRYLYSEKIRALASFERLEMPLKIQLGNALVERLLSGSSEPCDAWALGRVGARHLVYGSAGQVVPQGICTAWVERLLAHRALDVNRESLIFLFGQLARKTSQRELNLPESAIQKILTAHPDDVLRDWITKEHRLTQSEQEQILGDQLPAGLILEAEESE